MSAVRLEVETHIVSGAATSVQNLTKCIANASVQIDELVISSLASAEATLTDTEKELGVMVADIGGGTTDMAIFTDGAIYHSAVLPVGAINVTNDVAIGLRTSLNLAEEIKIKHGTASLAAVAAGGAAERGRPGRGRRADDPAPKLCEIIEARMSEIYSLIGEEVKRSGHAGMLPAGVVLTGGGARIAGAAELARDVFQMPVRVGVAAGRGRPDGPAVEPGLQHPHRAAAVGRPPCRRGADELTPPARRSAASAAASWTGSGASSRADPTAGSRRMWSQPPSLHRHVDGLWITPRPSVDKIGNASLGVAR